MKLRNALAAVAAFAAITAPSIAAPAHSQPALGADIVAFGDSFVANPDQFKNFTRGIPATSIQEYAWDYPSREGCLQAPNNWPRQLAKITRRHVEDWSCSGGNSTTLLHRIDRAIAKGDLNRGTTTVLISTGFNDYAPMNVINGASGDFRDIQNVYVRNLRTAAGKIRRVAPNARIIMPGLLSISEPTGLQRICLINVIPNMPGGIPLGHLQAMELGAHDAQKRAAREIGATFIDIKNESRANHSCAPDKNRWVAGFIDTTTENYNMAYHPSHAGSRYVANRVKQVL